MHKLNLCLACYIFNVYLKVSILYSFSNIYFSAHTLHQISSRPTFDSDLAILHLMHIGNAAALPLLLDLQIKSRFVLVPFVTSHRADLQIKVFCIGWEAVPQKIHQ